MEKSTERAFKALKAIKSELHDDVVKDWEMPSLCNTVTGETNGFAVQLTLSSRYTYKSDLLDDWRKRFEADCYVILIQRNRLIVRFLVHF